MKIVITNEQDFVAVDEKNIKTILNSLPSIPKNFRLSIVYLNDAEIAKLNERYLKHEGPTDVLAFSYSSQEGEILVSGETALREATERKIEPQGELLLYTIHGLLHLMGYDDHTVEEATTMHAIEKKTLLAAGYSWNWDEPIEAKP